MPTKNYLGYANKYSCITELSCLSMGFHPLSQHLAELGKQPPTEYKPKGRENGLSISIVISANLCVFADTETCL